MHAPGLAPRARLRDDRDISSGKVIEFFASGSRQCTWYGSRNLSSARAVQAPGNTGRSTFVRAGTRSSESRGRRIAEAISRRRDARVVATCCSHLTRNRFDLPCSIFERIAVVHHLLKELLAICGLLLQLRRQSSFQIPMMSLLCCTDAFLDLISGDSAHCR